ncbi:MAG: HPr family phosphocarrier protein [Rhodothermia bacterium]|nr:HPr family phosphocarrier protein [Rhodothermia bacterium]
MITRTVVVRNRAGLHTRPSSSLVKAASHFKSDFFIEKDGFEINGKSIIGVMTLAAEPGATLHLVFDGEDENEAADRICGLFEDGFGEEAMMSNAELARPNSPN